MMNFKDKRIKASDKMHPQPLAMEIMTVNKTGRFHKSGDFYCFILKCAQGRQGTDTTGAGEFTALTTQVHRKESTENKCKGDREEVCNMTFYKT